MQARKPQPGQGRKRPQSNYAFGWLSIAVRTLLLLLLVLWALYLWQHGWRW